MIRARVETPLGTVLVTADCDMLTELRFADAPAAEEPADSPVVSETVRWLALYFSGRDPGDIPKLAPAKTPFQNAVREALLSVPYGKTVSYDALAKRLHSSPRAIGQAVGKNPILLIVPCHRVIGKNGGLAGYAGGLERKAALLELERRGMDGHA